MRGSNLFNEILHEEILPTKQRKGRSPELLEKRNDLLIHRYVFYSLVTPRLRQETIIEKLSEELHLSTVTIPQIVEDNRVKVITLRKQEPKRIYFQKKYPHFVWDVKSLLQFN